VGTGAIAVSVGVSGTLTGNGTITPNGPNYFARLVSVNGTLAPSKILNLNSHLFLGGTATTLCTVTPTAADRAEVLLTARLNGRLSVIMDGTFSPSGTTRFTLLHAAGGILTDAREFSSVSIKYPTDQGFEPKITYDYVGNNVYLDLLFSQGGL
jgi:hypothetical protein